MRPLTYVSVVALSLASSTAAGQPRPATPPAAPPTAAPPTTTTPLTAATIAPTVDVNDPLLAPMPPAAHTLGSWRDVVTYINSRSPDVAIARAEIERSRGLWRQALGTVLPTLTGQINATYQVFTAGATPGLTGFYLEPNTGQVGYGQFSPAVPALANPSVIVGLTASVPIFSLSNWYNVGTADRAIKVKEITAEDRQRTVLAGVADAIVAAVTAERVAEVNRVGLKSSLQTLELTIRKQKLGSGTQLDVVRAAQDVSTARATLITGDEAVRKAREALGLALGFNDSWGVAQGVSLDEIGGMLKQICQPGKPEDRPDVRAAKATVEVDTRNVKTSYLAYAPTIQLSTTADVANTQLAAGPTGVATTTGGLVSTSRDYAWSITGLLTWPIFDGGIRYGTTRINKAQETEDKATLGLITRTAQQQVVQATRNVDVAEASKAVATQTRDLAKETARLTQVAFEAGTDTSFDLVTSQAAARQAELNLANAEFSVIQARLDALLAASNCKY